MPEWLTYTVLGLIVVFIGGWPWIARNLPGLANQEGRESAQPGTARQAGELDWPDEPPETWVEDLPPERPIVLAPRPLAIGLSDDPDLVVWDARQQWQRCWEIVHVEFPRLRAELGIAA